MKDSFISIKDVIELGVCIVMDMEVASDHFQASFDSGMNGEYLILAHKGSRLVETLASTLGTTVPLPSFTTLFGFEMNVHAIRHS